MYLVAFTEGSGIKEPSCLMLFKDMQVIFFVLAQQPAKSKLQ